MANRVTYSCNRVAPSRHRGAVRFGSRNDSDSVVGMTPWTRLCRIVYNRGSPAALLAHTTVRSTVLSIVDTTVWNTVELLYTVMNIYSKRGGIHVHAPWLVTTRWGCSPTPHTPHSFTTPLHRLQYLLSTLLFACLQPLLISFDPGSLITGSILPYCFFFS